MLKLFDGAEVQSKFFINDEAANPVDSKRSIIILRDVGNHFNVSTITLLRPKADIVDLCERFNLWTLLMPVFGGCIKRIRVIIVRCCLKRLIRFLSDLLCLSDFVLLCLSDFVLLCLSDFVRDRILFLSTAARAEQSYSCDNDYRGH